jgi:hypothetical protein
MSLLSLLIGAWLMVAPFALGYQRSGANWTSATSNSFWLGLAIVVVSLIGVQLFAWSVLRQARQAGVLPKQRQRATFSAAEARIRLTELEGTLTRLATLIAADLTARRNGDGNHDSDMLSSLPQPVPSGR